MRTQIIKVNNVGCEVFLIQQIELYIAYLFEFNQEFVAPHIQDSNNAEFNQEFMALHIQDSNNANCSKFSSKSHKTIYVTTNAKNLKKEHVIIKQRECHYKIFNYKFC